MSKQEPVFAEPEVEVTSSLDEVQAEVVLPVEPLSREDYHETINPREKTSCPDCGKQVSAKTLKYSHGPNCVVKKQKQSQPIISREDGNHSLGAEVTKEQECQSRMHHRRMESAARREHMVQKLMKNAF